MKLSLKPVARNKHQRPKTHPQTGALRTASKALRLAIKAAEAGDQRLAEVESQLEQTSGDLLRIRQGLSTGDPLDAESSAQKGRRLRALAGSLEPLIAEARLRQRQLDGSVQAASVAVAGELAALAKQRFEEAVSDAAKVLMPWCSNPATAARLASQTDAANRERARMMQSHFCPNSLAARNLLAEAEQALSRP